MAGLARAQQRFGLAALFATLGSFLRLGAHGNASKEAQQGSGHPIHRMLLKGRLDGMWAPRRGYDYPGYCYGTREARRRAKRGDWGVTLNNWIKANGGSYE